MSDPWAAICRTEAAVAFTPAAYCQPAVAARGSAIDQFYESLAQVLTLARPGDETLGPVLLLGLVAATEQYFRAILSGTIEVCPICRSKAAEAALSLESVDYYGADNLGHGLLENNSLASERELEKATGKMTGIALEQRGSLRSALQQYDKVCHLRHAVVHQLGYLSARNARGIGIDNASQSYRVRIEFAAVHAIGDVCQNVVRAYNSFLFKKVVELWVAERVLTGDWSKDKGRFSGLCRLYCSSHDGATPVRPYYRYLKLRPTVLSRAARP